MSNVLHRLLAAKFPIGCLVVGLVAARIVCHPFGDLYSNEYYLSTVAPIVLYFVVVEIAAFRRGRASLHKLPLKRRAAYILQPYGPFKTIFLSTAAIAILFMGPLQVRQNYADMLFATGKYNEAAQFYSTFPLLHRRVSLGLADRGPSPMNLESQVAWQQIAESVYGTESLEVAMSRYHQAQILGSRGEFDKAVELLKQAIPILRYNSTLEGFGAVSLRSAMFNDMLASQAKRSEEQAQFIDEARNAYQESLCVRTEHWGASHAKTVESRRCLIDFLHRSGSPALAKEHELSPVSAWDNVELWWQSGMVIMLGFLVLAVAQNHKNRLDPRGKHVESKVKKLYGNLTNRNGVIMANVDDLCTLLLYTGKIREAERLSKKVYKMAEESPDLVA